jgi:signal transduction histidine kinase
LAQYEEARLLDSKVLTALAVLLAAIEVFLDFTTWIQLNVAIVYGLPLVLAAASRSRRLVWAMAGSLVAATFIVYALQIPPGAFHLKEPFFVNRVLAAATVVLTATLIHVLITAIDALDARRRELDQQRMEAEEASDRKTRLLMSVSHDLRTPLTSIHLTADLVKSKLPDLAQALQANALALSDMVADVLDVSHFESGRVRLHESEFALDELIAEEYARMAPLAAAAGLALEHETLEPPVWLCADRVKLGRVLRNLLKNAIQFTPKGRVSVTTALAADGAVRVRVADTGLGIAREEFERIFAEFTQLHAAPSGDAGWGLGLAICRRLARLMDGDVTIESERARGSIFTIVLPAARVMAREGLRSRATPA